MLNSFRMFASNQDWDAAVQDTKNALYRNRRNSDLGAYAAEVIAERLLANRRQYLEFGPYWFAVKDALAHYGYRFGDFDDETMREEYRGRTHEHTFVAAERFKDFYRNY
ncbi:MAG: hypothetical protein Q3966_05235, partial [Neisseria sp.]|nr:hypothetical protein [Neisseria sp.]